MKKVFKPGDYKTHDFQVTEEHLASFDAGMVHPVCSTFVLAREMEWSSRLFVLDMCDEQEEGLGTMLHIDHKSPAMSGEQVTIKAKYKSLVGNDLTCDIQVNVNERLIATGQTGQKILSKKKISQIFTSLER